MKDTLPIAPEAYIIGRDFLSGEDMAVHSMHPESNRSALFVQIVGGDQPERVLFVVVECFLLVFDVSFIVIEGGQVFFIVLCLRCRYVFVSEKCLR